MGSRRTTAQQLADLEKQLGGLKEKKNKIDERIKTLSAVTNERKRKDDNRRFVLLGTIVLEDLPTHPELATYIRSRLPSVLKGEGDQRLFADFLKGNAA